MRILAGTVGLTVAVALGISVALPAWSFVTACLAAIVVIWAFSVALTS